MGDAYRPAHMTYGNQNPEKPVKRRLRFSDLKERGIVRNRVTLKNWIKNQGFPPGKMTGPNSRTWCEDEVESWHENRPIEHPHQRKPVTV
jgi:hypothetical protein